MAILSECRDDTDDMLWDIYTEEKGNIIHVIKAELIILTRTGFHWGLLNHLSVT